MTKASPRRINPPPDRLPTDVISVGSSVTQANALPGSVGTSVYTGWAVGIDSYSGGAEAHTSDVISITGTPNSTARIVVGNIVNGGLGLFGSDAKARASAFYNISGTSNVTGDLAIFNDRASAQEVRHLDHVDTHQGDPFFVDYTYDFSIREDTRIVDVSLDGAGNGSFWLELVLAVSASEVGDKNLYVSASAADYGDTIDSYLQPLTNDFSISSQAGWEVRAFGTPFDVSPDPVTLTRAQLGLEEPDVVSLPEPGTLFLFSMGFALLAFSRSRALNILL